MLESELVMIVSSKAHRPFQSRLVEILNFFRFAFPQKGNQSHLPKKKLTPSIKCSPRYLHDRHMLAIQRLEHNGTEHSSDQIGWSRSITSCLTISKRLVFIPFRLWLPTRLVKKMIFQPPSNRWTRFDASCRAWTDGARISMEHIYMQLSCVCACLYANCAVWHKIDCEDVDHKW